MSVQPQPEITSVSLRSYARLVRSNRNFRRVWGAQIVSELGDWFYTVAIYTLLLQLTGRAESVGVALLIQVLPQTFVGPLAGVVNDRISRKRVMIFTDLARCGIVLCMLFVRSPHSVWLVYPLLFLETLMVAFFEPARSALIPNIVARQDVVLANTLSSTTWSMNLVLGAALGGFVAALAGRDAVFVLNALSFLVSAFLLSGLDIHEPHTELHGPLGWSDLTEIGPIMEGIRYVRRDWRLFAAMLVKSALFVIGPSWVVYTVMGERDFPVRWHGLSQARGAMLGMSFLMGARGVGALLGPLIATRWSGHHQPRLRLAILAGIGAESAGYIALRFAGHLWSACAWIILAHAGGAIAWVFSTTLLQLNSEDRFRGRVFAADNGLAMLNIATGAFLSGLFMDWGYPARVVASGAGMLMLISVVLWGATVWAARKQDFLPLAPLP
jgi:MFS family permease